jgi:hypothetical protein
MALKSHILMSIMMLVADIIAGDKPTIIIGGKKYNC